MIGNQADHDSAPPVPKPWPQTIAIDGPAGAGKSTIANALANKLHYLYFDTGVLYRAVTLAAQQQGIASDDATRLAELARTANITVAPPTVSGEQDVTVWLEGVDVSRAIRTPEVNVAVSAVSAHAAVREALLPRQREIAARGGVIMAGRDIGTVVLPNADLKIYLEATLDTRAHRRALEEWQRGEQRPLTAVQAAMAARDDQDTHRALSPLRPAEGAKIIDTDDKDIETVLAIIDGYLQGPR